MPAGCDQPACVKGIAPVSNTSKQGCQWNIDPSACASATGCMTQEESGTADHRRKVLLMLVALCTCLCAQHTHNSKRALPHLGSERPRAEGPSLQLRAIQCCIIVDGAGAHDGEVDA